MNAIETEIEDIKDALASIDENGERKVGERAALQRRLEKLEAELIVFKSHPPAT
jgi:hypothetical protein